MKILIAEDSLTSRTMLTAMATKWGYEPIVAEDGEVAWEILQRHDAPGLLLLDWEMPRLDGVELCRRIRQRETTDPPFIILLTGRTETDDIVKGLETGANDYVAKPFNAAELQARLRVGQRMLKLQAELARIQETLSFQASHDVLTGLMNRRALMSMLEAEIARAQRQRQLLCIGLCDIDHFKHVNDTHGHLVGDAVLQEVAQRMKTTLRPYDHVGRYGGEEFLIVLNPDPDHILTAFERVRRAIADKPVVVESANLNLSISCGVTLVASAANPQDTKILLANADTALYEAKASGRNRSLLFEQTMEPKQARAS